MIKSLVASSNTDVEILENFRDLNHNQVLDKFKDIVDVADDLIEQSNGYLDNKKETIVKSNFK